MLYFSVCVYVCVVAGACDVGGAAELYRMAGETEWMPGAPKTARWHQPG